MAGLVIAAAPAWRRRPGLGLGGDDLSVTRLQDILGLTPGNLITHLRKLEDAGYARMVKTAKETSVSLTQDGRAALQRYTVTLRRLLDAAGQTQPQ